MDILVLAGMLGSGKTTRIAKLAGVFTKAGKKIVILENEISRRGIDDTWLRSQGFEVRELFAGCICCSLRNNLSQTVKEIREHFSPDVLLVEPSGIAGSAQIVQSLSDPQNSTGIVKSLALLDSARYPSPSWEDNPFIYGCMENTDAIWISKQDLLTTDEIKKVAAYIKENFPQQKLFGGTTSLQKETLEIFEWFKNSEQKNTAVNSKTIREISCATYLKSETLILNRENMDYLLTLPGRFYKIAQKIQYDTGSFVGHFKAIITNNQGECAKIGLSDLKQFPKWSMNLKADNRFWELRINCITCGLQNEALKKLADKYIPGRRHVRKRLKAVNE